MAEDLGRQIVFWHGHITFWVCICLNLLYINKQTCYVLRPQTKSKGLTEICQFHPIQLLTQRELIIYHIFHYCHFRVPKLDKSYSAVLLDRNRVRETEQGSHK